MTRPALLAAPLLSLALLAACGGDRAAPETTGAAPAAPVAPVAPAAPAAPVPDATLPAPKTGLALQTNHPNGTVLRVDGVSFAPDHIAVSMAVTNGHENEIKLNDHGRMVLMDNLGNRYNPSPPPADPDVRVQPGSTLEGQFIFLGRVAPAATSLSIVTNSRYGGDHDNSSTPKITVVNIPVR